MLDDEGTWAAASVAEGLARRGARVHLVSPTASVSAKITTYSRLALLKRFADLGIAVHPMRTARPAGADAVALGGPLAGADTLVKDVTTVVDAGSAQAADELYRQLDALPDGPGSTSSATRTPPARPSRPSTRDAWRVRSSAATTPRPQIACGTPTDPSVPVAARRGPVRPPEEETSMLDIEERLTLDERSAVDFVLGLRKRWADTVYPALREEYGATGAAATTVADASQVLRGLPLYPWFSHLERVQQKMLWKVAGDAVLSRREELTDQVTSVPEQPKGSWS